MPNAQQVSLNLVAQLDQGNIQSQAVQMASTMARAIEEAFKGIGEQIAISIMTGVRQGLTGSIEMIGQTRIGPGNVPTTESIRQIQSTAATTTMPRGVLTDQFGYPVGIGRQPEPVIPPGAPPPPPPVAPIPTTGQQPPTPRPAPTEEPDTEGGFMKTLSRNRMGIARGATAIGTALSVYGELPGIQRQAAASGAEIENLTARSAMRGDVEQMLAIQNLGGQGAMRDRAAHEEGAIIAGEVAAAIGIAFAPVTGGLSTLLAGAAVLGLGADAVRRTAGWNTRLEQNIMGQTDAERKKNEEIYTFLQKGRETAVRGFESARTAGAPELSGIMAGGLDSNISRNALVESRERLARIEQDPANNAGASFMGSTFRTQEQQLRQRIQELEQQAARADAGMVTSQGRHTSLRSLAANMGIGEQEFLQTMGQTAQGMGGVFLGQQPRLEQMPNQIAEIIRMQGLGLNNAAGMSGQLFQGGGMSRPESIELLRDLFEDAVSAGMDKAQVGRALTEMVNRAGQLGFGGGGAAAAEFQRGVGLAQTAFGENAEGPKMRFAQSVSGRLTQAGLSRTADLGKIGGQEGVERFAGRFRGLKMDRFARMEMQETAYDQKSLESFLRQHGASEEDIQREEAQGDLSTQLQAEKQRGVLGAAEKALGSREAAFQFVRRQTPEAGTGAGVEALRSVYEPLRRGQGTQPQIYDFDQRTGEFTKKAAAPTGMGELLDIDQRTGDPITRPIPAIEAGVMAAQGAAPARVSAQMDATQISAGLNDLNKVLDVLNPALNALVDRANRVLSGNTSGAAAPSTRSAPEGHLSNDQINMLIHGTSSSMRSSSPQSSSFKTTPWHG